MSAQSAYTALETGDSMPSVVATEPSCAAQTLDFVEDRPPGSGVQAAYRVIRERIPYLDYGRPVYQDSYIYARLI